MDKLNLSQVARNVRITLSKHSPEILTGIGIAGMVTTTIMAVRATPKALDIMTELKEKHSEDGKVTGKEIVKNVGPVYIPAAVTGAMSIVCLVGASSVNARRNAALATAYTLSETALKEYQDKVVETIGSEKEQVVRDAVAKDKIDSDPVSNREVIITGKGDVLCYDVISGRYFKSDRDRLEKVENDLNRQMRDEMYITLNDFYCEIGLDSISIGNDLGWNIDKGYIELRFSSQLADDGTPCLVVDHGTPPQYDYRW